MEWELFCYIICTNIGIFAFEANGILPTRQGHKRVDNLRFSTLL